jgi:hypothetical protein
MLDATSKTSESWGDTQHHQQAPVRKLGALATNLRASATTLRLPVSGQGALVTSLVALVTSLGLPLIIIEKSHKYHIFFGNADDTD